MLTPNFKIEPGDGTGCSIKDAAVRNDNGICGMFGCGQIANFTRGKYTFYGYLCSNCADEKDAVHEQSLRRLNEYWDKEISRLIHSLRKSKDSC